MRCNSVNGSFWAFALAVLAINSSAFGQHIWDGNSDSDGGDGINWTDALNWSPDTVPPNGSHIIFNDTAGVGTTTQLNGFANTVTHLYYSNTSGTHTTNLSAGTLQGNGNQFYVGNGVVGSTAVLENGALNWGNGGDWRIGYANTNGSGSLTLGTAGNPVALTTSNIGVFYVGVNDNPGGASIATGVLDLTHATGTLSTAGSFGFRVGLNRDADGTLTLGSGLTSSLGTSGNRADTRIGQLEGDGGAPSSATGLVTALGGDHSVYASNFIIGRNNVGSAGRSASGTLDYSAATSGTIESAGNTTQVGHGPNATGSATFGNGQTVSLGIASNRADVRVGDVDGGGNNIANSGTVTKAGGDMSIYATNFWVGRNNTINGTASGTLNFAGTTGTIESSGGSTQIGYGSNATANATFGDGQTISLGIASSRADVRIGDVDNVGGNGSTNATITKGAGAFSVYGTNLIIGRNNSGNGNASATLNLTGVTSGAIDTAGGLTWIGKDRDATANLVIPSGVALDIGKAGNRADFRVGEAEGNWGTWTSTTGSLTKTAGSTNITHNWFYVGRNFSGSGATNGTVDLTGTANGTLTNLDSPITGGGFWVEIGRGNNATGSVLLGGNMNVAWGRIGDPTEFRIGDHTVGVAGTTSGTLTRTAAGSGQINIFANNFLVGRKEDGGDIGSATGVVDLSGAGAGSTFDMRGNSLQAGRGRESSGSVTLGANFTTNIGLSSGSRVDVRIGDSIGHTGSTATSGSFTQTGGSMFLNPTVFYIGHNESNNGPGATGTVTLTAPTGELNMQGSGLRIGYGRNANGTLTLGGNMDLDIGSTSRVDVRIGDGIGTTGANKATGVLTKTSGNIDLYPSQLFVGHNEAGLSTGGDGTLNLNGTGTLNMRFNNLRVGVGVNANGNVNLGGAGFVGDIGASGQATNYQIGYLFNGTDSGDTVGNFTQTSGTFTGYANEFKVGQNNNGSGTSSVNGTFDITGATLAAGGLNVQPEFAVGRGLNATGLVRLGSGPGSVTGNTLLIGDNNAGGNAGGTGTVQMYGTQFIVNNQLNVDVSGYVENYVSGNSSGFTVVNTAGGALALDNHASAMLLSFANPNFTPDALNPYWGFRWLATDLTDAMNKATTLQGYVNEAGSLYTSGDGRIDVAITGGLLSIADLRIDTFIDGGNHYAYVGFINAVPEPSSLAMLAFGMISLWLFRRNKK